MSWKSKTTVAVLFILAGVGLLSQLYSDPFGLLKTFAIAAVFAGILYFAFARLLRSRTQSTTDSGYQKALKQQKNRLKKQHAQSPHTPVPSSKLKKMNRLKASARRDHPFQVINGKKNKPKTNETKTS